MIPLITIEGATASGKSALALVLAEELNSQIISADSRQVYKFLDIGTAKPSPEELDRVPHHLISIITPDQNYNAGRFIADAETVISSQQAMGVIPVICGGTGLYIASLLKGLFSLPSIDIQIRQQLVERMESEGLPVLYRELETVDPQFAGRISSNDKQRILRGLEVFHATGIPLSEHWQKQQNLQRYRCFRILLDLPRPLLYARINQRIVRMLEKGLLHEIEAVLNRGYSPDCPGLNSLGYKEFIPHLCLGADLSLCLDRAAQHSRNYAKRQCTWYRKYKFDLTLSDPDFILSNITGKVNAWIEKENLV